MSKKEYRDLGEFLEDKFLQWQVKRGRSASQNDYARHLGVSAGNFSQWKRGNRLPVGDNIHVLARALGPEVYDLVGVPRQMPEDPFVNWVVDQLYVVSDEARAEVRQVIENHGGSAFIREEAIGNVD